LGYDVIFQFFGSVGMKISNVNVGFVGSMVELCDESVEKLWKLILIREDVDASQVDGIIMIGGGGE